MNYDLIIEKIRKLVKEMCIRDSLDLFYIKRFLRGVIHLLQGLELITNVVDDPAGLFITAFPVSYTHLDVYKRQITERTSDFTLQITIPCPTIALCGRKPMEPEAPE